MDSQAVEKRQILEDDYHDDYWWYSSDASAVKWSIVAAIFLIAFLWFVGGYYHAQSRMKKGMPPLAYHRWLVRRSQRERFQPQNNFFLYQQPNQYNEGYHGYAYPPPVYNPTYMPPPPYQSPQGGSKVNPSQQWPGPSSGQPLVGESSESSHQRRTSPVDVSFNANPHAESDGHPLLSPVPPKPTLLSRLKFFK